MERAHVSGVTVAFDVVPHTLYDRWDLSELAHVLAPVDVVTVEVRTIRRFLGLPAADVVHDHDVARATASVVGVHFKEKVFILRYGLGNIEETLYCWPGRDPMHASTGYVRTGTPRGFGDRLSARELPWVVQRVKQEARRRL
jgi:hypothetical protein